MVVEKRDIIKHIAYWAVLGIIFGLDYAYEEPLYKKSE
jgi:hypothetical protein